MKKPCLTFGCKTKAMIDSELCWHCANRQAVMAEAPKKHKSGKKRCSKCRAMKLVTAYSLNRAAPDGLEWHCRPCRKKKGRKPVDKQRHKLSEKPMDDEELFGGRQYSHLLRQPLGGML